MFPAAAESKDVLVPLSGSDKEPLRKKSPFKATICQEDLQHIKAIEATNVQTTPPQMLIAILYKTVTKPVQGGLREFLGNYQFLAEIIVWT